MESKVKQNDLEFFELIEKPSSKKLAQYYAKKYYQETKGGYEKSYSDSELLYITNKLNQKYKIIQTRFGKDLTSRSFLDVGCGEGFALKYFSNMGHVVKGVDYSSEGVCSHNPSMLKHLITTDIFEFMEQQINIGNTYDIIWLQNVLEHVSDPVQMLNSIQELVSKDSILVLTVPNDFSSLQIEAMRLNHIDNEFWVIAPDHISYFNAASIYKIAEATGWNCIDLLGDFPIDWYLYNESSNYIQNKKTGKNAHTARIQIENLLSKQPAEQVNAFYRELAKMGMGRDLTAYLVSS